MTEYKIIKYAEQLSPKVPIAHGMWAVIEISEQVIAFTETDTAANALVRRLRGSKD